MSLNRHSHEEIEKMSMVDVANLLLLEEKKPMTFKEAFDKVAQLKNWDESRKQTKISQFYTDLNIDGRFVTNGSNTWGLKRWYRVDQMNEEFATAEMDNIDEDIDNELELEELDIDEFDAYADDDADEFDDEFVEEDDV